MINVISLMWRLTRKIDNCYKWIHVLWYISDCSNVCRISFRKIESHGSEIKDTEEKTQKYAKRDTFPIYLFEAIPLEEISLYKD